MSTATPSDWAVMGDGCRIAYRVDGPKDAPVLMLSNSLGTTMAMWTPQMARLSKRFRVLRYDSRGHGQSGVLPGGYGMDRLGRDAIELLDALEIERATFCGLSKGGMVGQWLGVRAPDRLDRLVLCNTSPYMGPPSSWQDRIRLVASEGMAAIADVVLNRWFTPGFLASTPDKVAPVRRMLLGTDPVGYAGCCAAIRDMDMRPLLPLITTPTLVIAGAHDLATPLDQSEMLVKGLKDAQLRINDAAHLSTVEQADDFLDALEAFI